MAQTLERLTRRTDTMQGIRGIVHTMKTMSAINAAPYEQAARAIDSWRGTVLDGLHAFLRANGPLAGAATTDPARTILVVIGSDHGLCGNYNELVAEKAVRHAMADGSTRILCVGAQMADALDGAGLAPEAVVLPPANVDGLGRLAGDLVTRLDGMGGGDVAVTLVYTQRGDHGRQAPVVLSLLPVDADLLDALARRPWASRSLPQVTAHAPDLFAALIRNLLFATVHRAAAEALVTENAARLARMQQAERSVDERLEDLRAETRMVRQAEITTELLDVIVGFEALKARRRGKLAAPPATN